MSSAGDPEKEQEAQYYKKQVNELAGTIVGLQYNIAEMGKEAGQMKRAFDLMASLQYKYKDSQDFSEVYDHLTEEILICMKMDTAMILVPAPEGEGYYAAKHIRGYEASETALIQSATVELPAAFTGSKEPLLVNSKTPATDIINSLQKGLLLNYFMLVPIAFRDGAVHFLITGRKLEGRTLGTPILADYHLQALTAIVNIIAAIKDQFDYLKTIENKVVERTIKIRKQKEKIELQKKKLQTEKAKSESLLLNILPKQTAKELKKNGKARPRRFERVTVLFSDFKDFTTIAGQLDAEQLVGELDYCFQAFDTIMTKYGLEKIKTIGDAYMCAAGLPLADNEGAHKMIKAAIDMQAFLHELHQQRPSFHLFNMRIGIHTGPVIAGVVGRKKFAYDIWGDTVNIASRMESAAEHGKVNISSATYELIKEDFECIYRGKLEAKNKGEMDMYFVVRAKKERPNEQQ